jgi:uncharacterized protein YecE (DUF72 family)
MQNSLFPEPSSVADAATPAKKAGRQQVKAAVFDTALRELAAALPVPLRFGTSSWNYPGWTDLVWERDYADATLSRHGLPAYAQHPLLRTVGIDRTYYKPLDAAQFAAYAAQVPEDFRFVVKAPGLVADALVRDDEGRGLHPNPSFLDAATAMHYFVTPALEGLGSKIGALVFQLSPLPQAWLEQMPRLIARLRDLLRALPDVRGTAPDGVIAVEVRDREWLRPEFVQALRESHVTYCLGLHAKMPCIEEQLPILRALWPGPLVCRWNLNPLHGAFGYENARDQYSPFDKLVDQDPATRAVLARVIAGTLKGGQQAYVTLSNKAEGCAPLSIVALAQEVRRLREAGGDAG